MEYTTSGSSGTKATRIGIGTDAFGGDAEWHLSATEAQDVVDTTVEHGVNFSDTANAYNISSLRRLCIGMSVPGSMRDSATVASGP
jgi:aryl-alcohol dehydrogenase-like predicted oxidoreductase